MSWLRRFFGLPEQGWPTRTPPTTAGRERPQFHCPQCRTPVAEAMATCPMCGTRLPDGT